MSRDSQLAQSLSGHNSRSDVPLYKYVVKNLFKKLRNEPALCVVSWLIFVVVARPLTG